MIKKYLLDLDELLNKDACRDDKDGYAISLNGRQLLAELNRVGLKAIYIVDSNSLGIRMKYIQITIEEETKNGKA